MKILKELSCFYNFFYKTPEEHKNIVFYAEHEGYYPNFEGIIKELKKRNTKLCYVTSSYDDPILKSPDSSLISFYIKSLLPIFMLFVKSKVFFITLTDLNQFHIKRSIYPVHYVYVFHSMVSTHMMYLKGAFDHYDSILCCGPHHIKELRKYEELHGLPKKNLIEAGYYRLERIYDKYRYYEAKSNKNKLTILIAPSWGERNLIESYGPQLVNLLLNSGFKVILRPHPETIKRSTGIIRDLETNFENNPDFILEKSVYTDDSLLKADILICDCSGIALEYAFGTERPVLFIDVPYKIRNKDYKELDIEPIELSLRPKFGKIVSPENLKAIPKTIQDLYKNNLEYKNRLISLREDNVFNFGISSQIGADYINKLLN